MSMNIHVEGERLAVARIHGLLRRAEFDASQRAAGELIGAVGRGAVLVVLDGFQG